MYGDGFSIEFYPLFSYSADPGCKAPNLPAGYGVKFTPGLMEVAPSKVGDYCYVCVYSSRVLC